MKIRDLIIIGLTIVMVATVFGNVRASTNTNGLPMPFGENDLTDVSNPSSAPDPLNFYGVRVSNNQWYTFVEGEGNEENENYYLNSKYEDCDVNHNGINGNASDTPDMQDVNYYDFVKGGMGYPPVVYHWVNNGNWIHQNWEYVPVDGSVENHHYGVSGVVGVNINSYSELSGGNGIVITIMTAYQDNYIQGYSQSELKDKHGEITDSDHTSTNSYLHTILYVQKINDASKQTSVKWGTVYQGSADDDYGINACPGDYIKYAHQNENLAGDLAKAEAKYLINFAANEVTSAATAVYGPYASGAELAGGDVYYRF